MAPAKICNEVRYILLTYSQVSTTFDPDKVVDLLSDLGAETLIISLEKHEDGGSHYHALGEFAKPFTTRSARKFDVDGHHPNIEKVGKTPWMAFDYVAKDGEVVGGTCERPKESTGRRNESNSDWAEIVACDTEAEFYDALRNLKPGDLVRCFSNIQRYAAWRWSPKEVAYTARQEEDFNLDGYPGIEQWKLENLNNEVYVYIF